MVDTRRSSPVYALRFNANGRRQYVTLGSARDGWTQAKAQDQLERELASVRLGTWKAVEPEPAPEVDADPTFHVFASDWFEASKGESAAVAGDASAGKVVSVQSVAGSS